ncbi:Vesicle coat complex COPII Sec23/Sec24 [Spraguea lophii 42_110]|uniref:Vesicle coat complex COPII Sec23/Sec24 n=1 Tax=Spraguea lophii (strain 42_110) TaxID=1358809 RepID=S7WAB9_SPRLO|nr:Vesicle coat complex COPII Sec23/Sec24 [Spraguea lophii 42_110]
MDYFDTRFPNEYTASKEEKKKPVILVPSLPEELESNKIQYVSHSTNQTPPPLCTTDSFINEVKNSSCLLLKSSIYTVPANKSMFSSAGIPFLVVLQPFNEKHSMVEKHIENAYLCNECRSFANPHSRIDNVEYKFYCNLCGKENKTGREMHIVDPSIEYYGVTDKTTRENIEEVSQGYFNKMIFNSAVMIFGIEYTTTNIPHLNSIFNKIQDIIEDPAFKDNFSHYVIILFNTNCEILTIEDDQLSIKKFIGEEVLITPKYSIDVNTDSGNIFDFLKQLRPTEKNSHPDILFSIANGLCNYFVGGKTAIFMTHSRPFSFLDTIIDQFIDSRNSLFIFDAGDRSTEHPYTRIVIETNGSIHQIQKLYYLKDICLSETAYGVMVELKTSDFIKKDNVYANTSIGSTYHLYFSSMDQNSTISYSFALDENMRDGQHLYIQAILRYYKRGEYKTMVLNQGFVSSTKYSNVFNNVSLDVIFAYFCKNMSLTISELKKKSEDCKNIILTMLKTYRTKCSPEAKPSQLVLPDMIKSLPNLYLSLCKNIYFSTQPNLYVMQNISNSPLKNILRFFYPRLFSFAEYFMEQDIKSIKSLQLNYNSLDSSEVYILENGVKVYIFIGSGVDKELSDVLCEYAYLMEDVDRTEEETVLDALIAELEDEYNSSLEVVIILQGESKAEAEFLGYMVEERMNNLQNYADFLCDIHYDIQQW